jgi:hypothetical protein
MVMPLPPSAPSQAMHIERRATMHRLIPLRAPLNTIRQRRPEPWSRCHDWDCRLHSAQATHCWLAVRRSGTNSEARCDRRKSSEHYRRRIFDLTNTATTAGHPPRSRFLARECNRCPRSRQRRRHSIIESRLRRASRRGWPTASGLYKPRPVRRALCSSMAGGAEVIWHNLRGVVRASNDASLFFRNCRLARKKGD